MTALIDPLARLMRTTAFRIIALYVALFVIAGTVVGMLIVWSINQTMTESVVSNLARERAALVSLAARDGVAGLSEEVRRRSSTGGERLYLLQTDAAGRLAGNLAMPPPELGPDGGVFRYVSPGNDKRMATGVAVRLPNGLQLIVARDIEDQRELAARIRWILLFGLAALAFTGLAGGVVASRLMMRRVETINATTRRIMHGDLSQRVPLERTGDEIDDLATNLNEMLDRIEQLMAGLREVSDNIAHDLKTPLTRLRARAEAALRDTGRSEVWRSGLERTLEDADDLMRTFNALLLVARLESGAVDESMTTFDLATVVTDVCELYDPVAEEALLGLDVTIMARPRVNANRELIGQAVANLIDNAIKYSADGVPGKSVTVTLDAGSSDIVMSVGDRGPGIKVEDRARALRRFVRLEASRTRPGTGLGLSLVAAVARLHGGRVALSDNAPGLKVTLHLPSRILVPVTDQQVLAREHRDCEV